MSFGPGQRDLVPKPRDFGIGKKKENDDSMDFTREKGNSLDFKISMRNDNDIDAVDIVSHELSKNLEIQQSFGALDSPKLQHLKRK